MAKVAHWRLFWLDIGKEVKLFNQRAKNKYKSKNCYLIEIDCAANHENTVGREEVYGA